MRHSYLLTFLLSCLSYLSHLVSPLLYRTYTTKHLRNRQAKFWNCAKAEFLLVEDLEILKSVYNKEWGKMLAFQNSS